MHTLLAPVHNHADLVKAAHQKHGLGHRNAIQHLIGETKGLWLIRVIFVIICGICML